MNGDLYSRAIRIVLPMGTNPQPEESRLKAECPDSSDADIAGAIAYAKRLPAQNWELGETFLAGKTTYQELERVLRVNYPAIDADAISILANRIAYDAGK